MLRLEDDWVWDSWIADDGERYHLFYLKAPRSLTDPGLRHERAVIGHATSVDLVTWDVHPDALGPASGSWDDLALWTGSTVRGDDGAWRMFYTAINTGGNGVKDQRVGVAVSTDLETWQRVGRSPALEADARWYKTLSGGPASETWRDPFVFRMPDGWHMFVTARSVDAEPQEDGVVAHATSDDMARWTLGPPVTAPAGFGQLEVVQVREIDGEWVMVFTCHPQERPAALVERDGAYCTWSVTGADGPLGPWDIATAKPFTAEPALFAAPLVQRRDGSWAILGFRNTEPEGIFAFELLDPIPVAVRDGRLVAIEGTAA